MTKIIVFGVALGELEISPMTVSFLVLLTVITFGSVGLSSLNLIKSTTEEDVGEEDQE